MSHVQLDAYLDASEAALRQAMAKASPPAEPATRRFTGTDLFPALNTFGEREAMFFARDGRMVSLSGKEFADLSPEQRRDPTLELALFRSATWPYYGYPRGFLAKESGAYRVRFRGRAVRQMRDFRLVPAYAPIAMSFRARQPSGPDVSGDVRETGGWLDLQPEPRDFETTIQLKAGETFEYSPLGLPVPFIRTDGGFFYDYPPMPPDGHRGVAIQWLEVTGPLREPEWPPQAHRVLFDNVPPEGGTAAEAERLFRRFSALAALRPMSEQAHEPFLKLIRAKLSGGGAFSDALLAGYQALLCSSHCLYLTEPREGAVDAHFAIANRLSHFLWNSRPDDELTQLASAGRLRDAPVLRLQTERLIADPRFEEFVTTFAEEWLVRLPAHWSQRSLRGKAAEQPLRIRRGAPRQRDIVEQHAMRLRRPLRLAQRPGDFEPLDCHAAMTLRRHGRIVVIEAAVRADKRHGKSERAVFESLARLEANRRLKVPRVRLQIYPSTGLAHIAGDVRP